MTATAKEAGKVLNCHVDGEGVELEDVGGDVEFCGELVPCG